MELSNAVRAIPIESSAERLRMKPVREDSSDADLFTLSAEGNEEAFTALYRRHEAPVFRFAWHMLGRRDLAEEVTQEVFLTLLRHPRHYRPERGPLQAFLMGVARNHVRRQARDLCPAASDLDELAQVLPASESDPFDRCSKTKELQALQAAVLSLPPRYREVVVLCDLEEVNYADAARLLGCLTGTVRSRLHRARHILSAKLARRERCPV